MRYLAALLLFVGSAFAQQGNTIIIPVHGAPAGHCAALMLAVDVDGGTLYDCTITAGVGNWTAVGASGSGVPGGGTNTTQYNAGGGNFGGVSAGSAGQALISNGAGSPPSFQDPIVSGPDAVAATPTKNPVQTGCLFLTAPATLTNNQVGALQCDSSQDLLVKFINSTLAVTGTFWQATQPISIADGSDTTLGAKADAKSTATDTTAVSAISVLKEISAMEQAPASRAVTNAGTFAVQATLQASSGTDIGKLTENQSVNVAQIAGTTTDTNSGSKSAGTQRVVIATDQPTLTNPLDFNLKNLGGNAVTTTDNGTQGVAPQGTASSTGAVLACNILSAASTNSTNCKGSAGNFYGFEIYNTTTTIYYLRLYNTASAPTCSSATGFIRSIPIKPADAAGGLGGAISNQQFPVNYGTGISFCITGGSSSTDNTNAAVGIFGEIRYK